MNKLHFKGAAQASLQMCCTGCIPSGSTVQIEFQGAARVEDLADVLHKLHLRCAALCFIADALHGLQT